MEHLIKKKLEYTKNTINTLSIKFIVKKKITFLYIILMDVK